MDASKPWCVCTDIDGTLIDAVNYDHEVAKPCVKRCTAASVPVVLCSSKTRSEMSKLREELELQEQPCICENGAAILTPPGYFTAEQSKQALADVGIDGSMVKLPASADGAESFDAILLGKQAVEVRAALADAKAAMPDIPGIANMKSFYDLPVETVAATTQLDLEGARRAQQRDYSDTVCTPFKPEELSTLQEYLGKRGVNIVCGGRFHTATGSGSDKGKATLLMKALLQRKLGCNVNVVALGDAVNDIPLLRAGDTSYLCKRPDGKHIDAADPDGKCIRTVGIGPLGWVESVGALLDAQ